MIWLAVEADDSVASAAMMEMLLCGPLNDVRDRGFVMDYYIRAKEFKGGEAAPREPPGRLAHLGRADERGPALEQRVPPEEGSDEREET